MVKENILASHPFVDRVLTDVRPVLDTIGNQLKDIAKKSGKIRVKEEQVFSKSQYYTVVVFRKALLLLDYICQLEDSKNFITRFPTPQKYEKEGITQYRWLEYHYSHYLVTLVSLSDLALILVNVVFRLGIPEKLCKGELIKKNEWVKDTSVHENLLSLEKIIHDYRPLRNLYVHRGQIPELHEVFKSELLDHLKLHSFLNQTGDPVVAQQLLELVYKKEISKIVEILDAEISQTKQTVQKLLDSLFPIYKQYTLLLKLQESANEPKMEP